MGLSTIQEIEHAIRALKPRELEELYSWLDENCPQPLDTRVQSDLTGGRLDKAIHRALDDEDEVGFGRFSDIPLNALTSCGTYQVL